MVGKKLKELALRLKGLSTPWFGGSQRTHYKGDAAL
jgi:hypothetical protein